MAETETEAQDDLTSAGPMPCLPGMDPTEMVRGEVQTIIRTGNKSGAAIAREAGIPNSTFSAWLNGTYAGRNEPFTEKMQAWLDARKVQQHTRALMPAAPGFVATKSAEAIIAVFEHAQHAPDFAVVDGGPGVGKTVTCKEYARRAPNVWMVTAEPGWNTPRMLLDCVAEGLGVTERYSTQKISRAIVQRVRRCGGLLIVDEANHLSSQSIDQLRTFHDLAEVGIALVGNATVYSRLEGDGRKPQFAQLYSRIGMRLSRGKPYARDVDALLDAWQIETAGERQLLHTIARQPGALRGMTKTLRMAFMLAGIGGRATVTAKDIAAAWSQISGTNINSEAA